MKKKKIEKLFVFLIFVHSIDRTPYTYAQLTSAFNTTPIFECNVFRFKNVVAVTRKSIVSSFKYILYAEMNAENRICGNFLTDFLRLRARHKCHVWL